MLKLFLKSADIIQNYPILNDYLREDDISYDLVIERAAIDLQRDLKNRGLEIKKLCTPLYLTADVITEDKIERDRFVMEITDINSPCVISLYGTNTENEDPTTLLFTDVIDSIGEYTKLLNNPRTYYKLVLSNTTGLISTAYLIETSLERPHEFLTISYCYERLNQLKDDIYSNSRLDYFKMYEDSIKNIRYSYDDDLTGEIEKSDYSFGVVRIGR